MIYVPAFGLLTSGLDRRLGHFTITALRYYNLTGFVGWLWRFRILGRSEQSRGHGRSFDQRVLPVQLRVDRALSLPLGQVVYAVARKR